METVELVDDYIDVGYMAEDFEVCSPEGEAKTIIKQVKPPMMQLFVSLPSLEDRFLKEIKILDELLSDVQVDMRCYLLFAKGCEGAQSVAEKFTTFETLLDCEGEFGELYGTKIVSGPYKDALTKALFLISKDGAVYHIDMPASLNTPFDLQKLRIESNKAYTTYNGTGCHG